MKRALFWIALLCALGPSCGARTTLLDENASTSGAAGGAAAGGAGTAGTAGSSAGSAGLDITACDKPSDCTYVNTSCCHCGPTRREELVAVNGSYKDRVPRPQCDGSCPPCPPPQPGFDLGQYLITPCEHQHCKLLDVRDTTLTLCRFDSDCSLRSGLTCCEDCSGFWVALSEPNALSSLVCDGPHSCPACIPPLYPGDFTAACVDSECAVTVKPPHL